MCRCGWCYCCCRAQPGTAEGSIKSESQGDLTDLGDPELTFGSPPSTALPGRHSGRLLSLAVRARRAPGLCCDPVASPTLSSGLCTLFLSPRTVGVDLFRNSTAGRQRLTSAAELPRGLLEGGPWAVRAGGRASGRCAGHRGVSPHTTCGGDRGSWPPSPQTCFLLAGVEPLTPALTLGDRQLLLPSG